MQEIRRTSNKPTKYAKISLKKRIQLLKLVQQQYYSIAKASIKLNIRLSTAKLIVKKYRQEGKIFEKKSDRQERLTKSRKEEVAHRQTIEEPAQRRMNDPELSSHIDNSIWMQNVWFDAGLITYCNWGIQDIYGKQLLFSGLSGLYYLPYTPFLPYSQIPFMNQQYSP